VEWQFDGMPPLPDNIGASTVNNVFKTKGFARYARREGLDDAALCEAIDRADRGIIDADLGQGVIKQRVARPGQGRSGGIRVIVFYRLGERIVFVDGFAKNEKDNISIDELADFRELAGEFLTYSTDYVQILLDNGKWIKVVCDGKNIP
jgi:hypothetical protein